MTTAAPLLADYPARPAVGIPLDRHVMRGATVVPKRPLVRYHGGKWRMAPRLDG